MTNEENKLLGAKVPQEWINKFEELAKQTGRSVTDLVRDALAQYIGIDENSSRIISQLEQFQNELKLLRQRVTETEFYKTQIKDVSFRLAVVEQSLAKVQILNSPVVSRPPKPQLIKSEVYEDDFEDEPDEVLSDFMPRDLEG